jgi:hypothetical protein
MGTVRYQTSFSSSHPRPDPPPPLLYFLGFEDGAQEARDQPHHGEGTTNQSTNRGQEFIPLFAFLHNTH